ncbi:FecR domain-containing protein [Sphingobacterium thalpophilum]|uniref:FecR domain-containing protein n=1 Tax=Sphingobacterium thalpophilum TaxID=259 RepID=A0ABV4H8M2_9SPHI
MKTKKTIQHIIRKYLKRKASKREEEQLFTFYSHIESQPNEWNETIHGNKKVLEHILWQRINRSISDDQTIHKASDPFFNRLKIAMAVIVLCLAGVMLWLYQSTEKKEAIERATVVPGSDRAVLQLADGRRVYLDSTTSGEISFASGDAVRLSRKGELDYSHIEGVGHKPELHTITVPRGGQFKVKLSDGTTVWLNASSSLTFPSYFSEDNRRVKLIGEGYFDVAKVTKKSNPQERLSFIVETDKQQVEVLGTVFNISAYPEEEQVKTTLIEGSVKVSPAHLFAPQLLKPGQQSVLNGEKFSIQQVNVGQSTAWKTGDFTFDEMPLEEIMRQLSRWYDVEVVYYGNIGKIKFGGSISRGKDIHEVLEVLKLTGIHFDLKGRRIMVTP